MYSNELNRMQADVDTQSIDSIVFYLNSMTEYDYYMESYFWVHKYVGVHEFKGLL